MGTKNCKETPRQRMIGMMYLFLTAMLAINVSNEILDAFSIIDNGLKNTLNTFEEKNKGTYADFRNAFEANPKKVRSAWNNAMLVRQKSDSLCALIKTLKEELVKRADGKEYDMNNIKNKDNLDIPAEIMLVKRKGVKLKKGINAYRHLILGFIQEKDSTLRKTIAEELNTSDPKHEEPGAPIYTWESLRFSHTPLIGAVTLLSQLQTDVRNTESDVINYLFNQIEAESFKFNKLKAEVFAPSNYILKGDVYKAEIFLTAVDTTQNPRVFIGRNELKKFEDGRAIYRYKTSKVGEHKWGGILIYKSPSGIEKRLKFSSSYIVAEPAVVVSPTKMNVFYMGVDNPVSVSASGFAKNKVRASISNGNGELIKQSNGEYIAKPKFIGKLAKVKVEAYSDGKWQHLHTVDFRVKPIPDPVAKVAGKTGGKIKKNLLRAQRGVDAVLDNFDFDLKFQIKSFNVSTVVKGYTVDKYSKNSFFTAEQKALFNGLRRNQKVYIEDIKAVGPDGITRHLPTIVFRIK